MKKRSLIALLLTCVMIFAMSVTSFASTNDNPVLKINGQVVNYTMPTTKQCPNMPSNAENANVITAADILLAYAPSGVVCNWDQNYLNDDGEAGLYISKYLGNDTVNNYELISYNRNRNEYTYKWTGAYWSLSINDSYASSYATAYKASDIESIGFDYITDNIGYTFTTNYRIQ